MSIFKPAVLDEMNQRYEAFKKALADPKNSENWWPLRDCANDNSTTPEEVLKMAVEHIKELKLRSDKYTAWDVFTIMIGGEQHNEPIGLAVLSRALRIFFNVSRDHWCNLVETLTAHDEIKITDAMIRKIERAEAPTEAEEDAWHVYMACCAASYELGRPCFGERDYNEEKKG